MSATYRIETEHLPANAASGGWLWCAKITRLSDEQFVGHGWGDSEHAAQLSAREKIVALGAQQNGSTAYMNDDGEIVAVEPESVRA